MSSSRTPLTHPHSDSLKSRIRAQYVPGYVGYRTLARLHGLTPNEIKHFIHDPEPQPPKKLSRECYEAVRAIATNHGMEIKEKIVGKKLWHFCQRLWEHYSITLTYEQCLTVVEKILTNKANAIKHAGDKTFYAIDLPQYPDSPVFIVAMNLNGALVTAYKPSLFEQNHEGKWIKKRMHFSKQGCPSRPSLWKKAHAPQRKASASL